MTDNKNKINKALHGLLGVDSPCETACTHVVVGRWTCLGIAHVLARVEDDNPLPRGRASEV